MCAPFVISFLLRALTSTFWWLSIFHFLTIQALLQALGDRKGINRFGDFSAPLDEALIHVALVSANFLGTLFQCSHIFCLIFCLKGIAL